MDDNKNVKCEMTLMTNLQLYCRCDFPNVKRVKVLIKDISSYKTYQLAKAAEKIVEEPATRLYMYLMYIAMIYMYLNNN